MKALLNPNSKRILLRPIIELTAAKTPKYPTGNNRASNTVWMKLTGKPINVVSVFH